MTAPTTLTKSAFARHLGCRPSYVTKLGHEGRLVLDAAGHVVVAESMALIKNTGGGREDVAQRHAQTRGQLAGGAQVPSPGSSGSIAAPPEPSDRAAMGLQQARAVHERYKALSAKMEYERLVGKLVEIETITRAGVNLGTWLRAAVENLVPQLAAEMYAAKDPEQGHAILVERFEQLLTDYSAAIVAELKPENLAK